MTWPVPGGWLDRLGAPPEAIEERSRGLALDAVAGRWSGRAAELAAAVVYAAGDPDLASGLSIRLGSVPTPRAVLADIGMVAAGLRSSLAVGVATRAEGAHELAAAGRTTRAAAGTALLWEEFGRDGLVVVGNAPTALLAVLDLAATARPAFVVATCPGFTLAEAAKAALAASGLPHLAVLGTRGGSGVAAAAANTVLGWR